MWAWFLHLTCQRGFGPLPPVSYASNQSCHAALKVNVDETKEAKTYHVQAEWDERGQDLPCSSRMGEHYLTPISEHVPWIRQLFLDQLICASLLSRIRKSSSPKYRSAMTDKHLEACLLPAPSNQLLRLHSWLQEANNLLPLPGLWLKK